MRLAILAVSFAGLCVPGIALAQDNTAEVMRTTPGAHCTGDIVDSQCTLTNSQYAAGNLGGETGAPYIATPVMTGATGTTGGTTGGSGGGLSPTPPSGSLGTGGGNMGGGSSGGSSGGGY